MSSTPETIVHIPLSQLRPGPGNLRGKDWPAPDPDLAASIRSVGIIEPLIVVRLDGSDGDVFGVVAGHRRTAAAMLAKQETAPAIIRQLDEKAAITQALIENLQREDLEPLDEATGYRRLIDLGLTQKDLAGKVGRSQGHISKRLALLRLPEPARQSLAEGKLHIEDALALEGFEPEVVERVVKNISAGQGPRWAGDVERWARGYRDELARNRKRAAGLELLQKAKVSVLKTNNYGQPAGRGWMELGKGYGRLPIAPSAHAKAPCHAAYVDGDGAPHYVCTKPDNHPKALKTSAPAAAREVRASKERQRAAMATRSRNATLKKRLPVRVSELERLIGAKQPREAVLDFVLRQLLQYVLATRGGLGKVSAIAAAALKVPAVKDAGFDWARYLAGGNASERLLRIAYAWALSSGEAPFQQLLDRNYFDPELRANAARYLAHLRGAGYKPDQVEIDALRPAERFLVGPPAFDAARKAPAKRGK